MRDRDLGERVLAFLDRQKLSSTPDNYNLGYLYLSGADPMLARAIDAVVMGGLLLSQREADAIMLKRQLGRDPSAANRDDEVRLQVLRLADLSADTAAATGAFGRELAENVDLIGDSGDTARLRGLMQTMVERTTVAEAQLQEMSSEATKLRAELEAVRSDALLDPLTGLANRRAADAELSRLAAGGGVWTLALCDVDHFKRVNDRFGHAVGDRVLKAVASTLSERCAPHMVARWGGEEFLVIFEGLAIARAHDMIDDARVSLGDRRLRVRETDEPLGRVTLSAGVASWRADGAARLLERADALLYAAKDAGRDCVHCEAH